MDVRPPGLDLTHHVRKRILVFSRQQRRRHLGDVQRKFDGVLREDGWRKKGVAFRESGQPGFDAGEPASDGLEFLGQAVQRASS